MSRIERKLRTRAKQTSTIQRLESRMLTDSRRSCVREFLRFDPHRNVYVGGPMTLTPEVLVIALEASSHRLETEFTAEQLREIIRSTHGQTRVPFSISGNKRALALRIVSLRHTLKRIERWGAAAE